MGESWKMTEKNGTETKRSTHREKVESICKLYKISWLLSNIEWVQLLDEQLWNGVSLNLTQILSEFKLSLKRLDFQFLQWVKEKLPFINCRYFSLHFLWRTENSRMKVKDTFSISWLSEVEEENRRQKEQITPPPKNHTSSAKSTYKKKKKTKTLWKQNKKNKKDYLSC